MAITLDAKPGSKTANSYITIAQADTYFEGRMSSNKWDDSTTDQQNRALASATRSIDNVLRSHFYPLLTISDYYYNQKLVWPWRTSAYYHASSATSGSSTTIVDTSLYSAGHYDDFWNNGSVLIYYTDDDLAPAGEMGTISGFTRDPDNLNATITISSALTADVEEGDYYIAIVPCPQWLLEATCEQAWFLLTDNGRIIEKAAMGVDSYSDGDKSFSLRKYTSWSRLCHETQQILKPFIPLPEVIRV